VLQKLRVKNFRLLRDVEIEFERDAPTVFVGPNGSGKSTVLEVLDFLSRCPEQGVQAAAAEHGGIRDIRTIGVDEPVVIEMIWLFSTGLGKPTERHWKLEWHISLQAARNGSVIIQREELIDAGSHSKRQLVVTDENGARAVFHEDDPNARPSMLPSSAQLAFEAFKDSKRFAGLAWLMRLLTRMNVLGALFTAPTWARAEKSQTSPRDSLILGPKTFLDRQGIGLANVLFHLFNEHSEAWEELERALRAELPFVRRLVFPPDLGGSRIAFAFEDERFSGRKVFASEMSDGMIAYLCLLASVLHPEQRGILGLDEPDANLHPSALRRFVALSHQKNLLRRLAIVTHSNALLDELRDPARSIRIVESTRSGARIRKLDPAALEAWRKDYSLSELRRTGLLDPSNASYGTEE
jgi:predicted ATPase